LSRAAPEVQTGPSRPERRRGIPRWRRPRLIFDSGRFESTIRVRRESAAPKLRSPPPNLRSPSALAPRSLRWTKPVRRRSSARRCRCRPPEAQLPLLASRWAAATTGLQKRRCRCRPPDGLPLLSASTSADAGLQMCHVRTCIELPRPCLQMLVLWLLLLKLLTCTAYHIQ
jgi:hypothetical protein